MACLSIVREHGPATVAAKSIFLFNAMTSIPGAEITFEVFDADAGQLKGLVGEHRFLHVADCVGVFWVQLKSLKPCESTHPGLKLLRHKPTLRGMTLPASRARVAASRSRGSFSMRRSRRLALVRAYSCGAMLSAGSASLICNCPSATSLQQRSRCRGALGTSSVSERGIIIPRFSTVSIRRRR
jgi:hypothetical protein